jgi:hypothetical protein
MNDNAVDGWLWIYRQLRRIDDLLEGEAIYAEGTLAADSQDRDGEEPLNVEYVHDPEFEEAIDQLKIKALTRSRMITPAE